MKKFFFLAALSIVTVFGVSATVATPSDNYTSSVTASVAGLDNPIEFDTKTLVTIYNLLPDEVRTMCIDSYAHISSRIEQTGKGLRYAGVRVTPITTDNGTDLKFSYGNHSVLVENYTKAEFDRIFGL